MMLSPPLPPPPPPSPLPLSARLRRHLARWRQLTDNEAILKIVEFGLDIEFKEEPRIRKRGPCFQGSDEQKRHLAQCLQKWLDQGVIEPTSISRAACLSLLFPVPKPKKGDWRWVLDLRSVNEHVMRPEFKLTGVAEVRQLIEAGAWMTKLDLSDAYLHVMVNRRSRRWLAFRALKGVYRMRAMIFGLSNAPYIFTMMMKPVIAHLHHLGIQCVVYLDDFCIWAASREAAIRATATTQRLLESLGFEINLSKSVVEPTQRLVYLGMVFDTTTTTLSVPTEKLAAIRKDARRVLKESAAGTLTVRRLAGLGGKIVATMPALRAASFRRHAIQRCVEFGLRQSGQNWDATVTLSRTALRDVRWWTTTAAKRSNGTAFVPKRPRSVLTTDASILGWGATFRSAAGAEWAAHGRWTRAEAARSSNWREATAIARAFFAFRTQIRTCGALLIRSDNTAAVSNIRRFGSRVRALGEAMEPVLRASFRWNVILMAEHVPGVLNGAADWWSRLQPTRNEWSIRRPIFRQLCDKLRFQPSIDLFASHQLHLCPRFASRGPDPLAAVVDAFSIEWAREQPLLIPPINLIPKVIGRLLIDRPQTALLVTPFWPTKPWFGTLKTMSRAEILLPEHAVWSETPLLKDSTTPRMMAWLI